jgi:protein-disulfide isomerase
MNNQQEDVQHHANKSTVARITPLATLVVGLVVGALLGYAGRPLVTPQPTPTVSVTSAETTDQSNASGASPSPGSANPTTLMDAVVAQTRHFKGDPNAPVTIVEFGDFK